MLHPFMIHCTWAASPQGLGTVWEDDRTCVDIFALHVIHEEGSFARAHLTLAAGTPLPPEKPWGILTTRLASGEPQVFFQGRRENLLPDAQEGLIVLPLIACPPDAEAQLAALLATYKSTSLFDPLFVPSHQLTNPHLIRFFQPLTFYWDPVTLVCRLDHLLESDQVYDVTPFYDPASLSVKSTGSPPAHLGVTLRAQWVQTVRGLMNLGDPISRLFPDGLISTFTSRSFKTSWPKRGYVLGHSGYWVASSSLTEIEPPSPEKGLSRPFPPHPTSPNPQTMAARRRWFRGKLVLGWSLQQKRLESVAFTLNGQSLFPHLSPESHPSQTLLLNLQAVTGEEDLALWQPHHAYKQGDQIQESGAVCQCTQDHLSRESFPEDGAFWEFKEPLPAPLSDSADASFFLTPRGQKAFEVGLEIAHTKLTLLERCLEVSFDLPCQGCPILSPQHLVILQERRLFPEAVRGKVIRKHIQLCGETGRQVQHITLGVRMRAHTAPSSPLSIPPDWPSTPSGIRYQSYLDQTPQDAYADISRLRYRPRLQELSLINDPEAQEARLREIMERGDPVPSRLLEGWDTRVVMTLQKLQPKESLNHTLQVTTARPAI